MYCFFLVDDIDVPNPSTNVGTVKELGAKCQVQLKSGELCNKRIKQPESQTTNCVKHLENHHMKEFLHYKIMRQYGKAEDEEARRGMEHLLDFTAGVQAGISKCYNLPIKID